MLCTASKSGLVRACFVSGFPKLGFDHTLLWQGPKIGVACTSRNKWSTGQLVRQEVGLGEWRRLLARVRDADEGASCWVCVGSDWGPGAEMPR